MADKTVKTVLKADVSDYNRGLLAAAAATKAFTKELNTSTDRATNLTQSVLAIGPALVPLSAAAVPALSGLSNQLAFAAAGAGVAALAFAGVGDALKATNDYALAPTAANFDKMQASLAELGPAGRDFVGFLQEIRPQLQGLQDAAQAGLLPGAEDGIRSLMELLPQAERIVSEVSGAIGDLMAEAGDNLASPRWAEFFTFLENEARPTLMDMGRTLGNFVEGFANLWMAFEPVSSNFSHSFLQLSRDFSAWTDGLDQTQGFQEFLDYINRVGPKVWDTLGSLGDALLQIVEAAAPVGELMLPVISALADTIGTIADSDLGPVIVGVVSLTAAYSRLIAVSQSANSSALSSLMGKSAYGGTVKDLKALPGAVLSYDAAAGRAQAKVGELARNTTRLGEAMRGTARLAGGAGGLAFVMSDLDSKMGLTNTGTLALAGSMAGPWGAALGGSVGLLRDMASSLDATNAALADFDRVLAAGGSVEQQTAALAAARDEFAKFKDDLGGFSLKDMMFTDIGSIKNGIQGLFGDNDLDKGEQALKDRAAALEESERAAQDAQFAEAGLGDAMDSASARTRSNTAAILDNISAMNAKRNAALAAANAELAYEQAIDGAHAAVEENGKTLDKTTAKGRANRTALYQLAGAWNELDPAAQNAEGAQERARRQFVRVATQMGATRKQAERLADKYMEIPPNVDTTVKLRGSDKAIEAANDIVNALNKINPFKDIYIRTHRSGDDAGNAARAPKKKADGGYISGPGTSRSDSIPAMLSNGEFVVNAAATSKNLDLLHRINAQKFADGGRVQPMPAPVYAGSVGGGGTQLLDVDVSGARVAFDKNFQPTLLGQIQVAIDSQTRYEAADRRQTRRPR